jgi:hypothetical protein
VKSISTVLNRSMLIVSFIRPAVERSPTFRERPCLRAPEPRDELPPLHLRPPEICQQIYRPGCIAVLTAVIKSRPSLHASGLLGTRRGLQAVNARMRQVVSTLGPHVRRCPTGPRRGVMVGRPRHCVHGRQAGSASHGARRAGLGDWAAAWEPKHAVPIARIPAKTVRPIISCPPGGGFRLAISQHCRQTVKAAQDRSAVIWSWRCPERRPE